MVNFTGASIVQLRSEIASGETNASDVVEEVILRADTIDTIFSKTNLQRRS